MSEEKPFIKVSAVCKEFEGKEVLKEASVDIKDGESLVLLGRSGAGKSVLLHMLQGSEESGDSLKMQTRIPKLMLGTFPFIGAAQFGRKAYEYRKMFFNNESNMKKLFIKSALLDVKFIYNYAVSISVGITSEAEMEATYSVTKNV